MTSMRQRFVDTASQLLEERSDTAVVLADISADAFAAAARRHPGRVVNVGIREQLMVSVAGGMALEGMRPFVHSYAPFLVERPFEQVKLDLSHQGVAAVLVSVGASYDASASGRTHYAPGDVALLDTLGSWTVEVPGHPDEAEHALRAAATSDRCTYVRLSDRSNREPHRGPAGVPGSFVAVRRGSRGVVVAAGPTLDPVLAATEQLDVAVLYASRVRPFDGASLRATVAASRPDVVLVEPYLAGTSSARVAEALRAVPHRCLALGVADVDPRRYGSPADHDRAQGLDARSLRASIAAFLAA